MNGVCFLVADTVTLICNNDGAAIWRLSLSKDSAVYPWQIIEQVKKKHLLSLSFKLSKTFGLKPFCYISARHYSGTRATD